jgi:hypothetical protein
LVLVLYTLLLPYALGITSSSNTFIQEGPWSLEVLRPPSFGLDYLEPIQHAFLEYTVKHDELSSHFCQFQREL